ITARAFGAGTRLESLEERDQVILVPLGKVQRETSVVEIDRVHQRGGRAVVEVRRTCSESAKNRTFELPYVSARAGHHGAPEVGHLSYLSRSVAHHSDQRKVQRSARGVR